MHIFLSFFLTGILGIFSRHSSSDNHTDNIGDSSPKEISHNASLENPLNTYEARLSFSGEPHEDIIKSFTDAAQDLLDFIQSPPPQISQLEEPYIDITIIPASNLNMTAYTSVEKWDPTGSVPLSSVILYDSEEVNNLPYERLYDLALHEIIHSVGFGLSWDRNGLIERNDELEAFYIGTSGNEKIPISDDGFHWDEIVFGSEIMTPFINSDSFLGDETRAAIEDLGYDLYEEVPDDGGVENEEYLL